MKWALLLMAAKKLWPVGIVIAAASLSDPSVHLHSPLVTWGFAAVGVVLVQGMKTLNVRGLRWLKADGTAGWAARGISLAVAALATIGIQWTFDSQAGVLTVTGLSVDRILSGLTLTNLPDTMGDAAGVWSAMEALFKNTLQGRAQA